MKLYILRHGDAGEAGDPRYKDNERPLTPKGIQRTKQLAHVLREMEITMDAVVTSPLTRARENPGDCKHHANYVHVCLLPAPTRVSPAFEA